MQNPLTLKRIGWWLTVALRGVVIVLTRVRSGGWERMPREGGVLLIANHLSYSDPVLLAALSPRPVHFIGARALLKSRFMRIVFGIFDVVAVDPNSALDALRRASDSLAAGQVVCIFPEGQISLDGTRLAFRGGFERIARRAGVPVLPVGIHYCSTWPFAFLNQSLRSRFRKLRNPYRAAVQVGNPIPPEQISMEAAQQAVTDMGMEAFARQPQLQWHLAEGAVRHLSRRGGRKLFVDCSAGRREMSAGMVLAVSLSLAALWRERLAGQRRVGVMFPSGMGGLLTNLALTLLDITPVNLNFTAGRIASEAAIRRAGIRTIISAQPVREKFPDFPWTDDFIDLLKERSKLKKAGIVARLAAVRLLPAAALLRLFSVPREGGEREAGLLFSSGSTGEAKGVVLTHRNIMGNCLQVETCGVLEHQQVLLSCLPLFHSFGFTVTLWYPLLFGLRSVMMPSPLETKRLADVIESEKVTVLLGTPTFFRPYFVRIDPAKLRSLRYVVAGAEKTPKGFHDRWEAHFGSAYLEGYGLTETTPVVSCNLPEREAHGLPAVRRAGSVGKLLPGMAARITEPASGEPLGVNEVGILELKGPNVFPGYLDDPEATAEVFNDGWFRTGDLARIDEDGFLFIEGRLRRFSKIGGEMVPHGTIEHEIALAFELTDSEVPMVAVTGVADPAKGETLVLLSAVDISRDELQKRLAARGLPNLWIPRNIRKVDAIPCLSSGKLDLQTLDQLAKGGGG